MSVTNPVTGKVEPASLPFYKSPVAVGILVTIFFQVVAIFFPRLVPFGMEEEVTEAIIQFISLVGAGIALVARWKAGLQPLTVSQDSKSATSS
jgi:hypothetical protein